MNHKKHTQVCYYRFEKFEINSRKRKKRFFELILISRKSLFLPGFLSHNIETYINEQSMTSRLPRRYLNSKLEFR
jgi:hypothetical protein